MFCGREKVVMDMILALRRRRSEFSADARAKAAWIGVRGCAMTSQAVAEHCGVPWSEDCLRFHEHVGHSFTFSETQVRRPLNRDGLGRWRRYERHLAPLIQGLRAYGAL